MQMKKSTSSFSSFLHHLMHSLFIPDRPSAARSCLDDAESPSRRIHEDITSLHRSGLYGRAMRFLVIKGHFSQAVQLSGLLPCTLRRPCDELCAALARAGLHQEKEASVHFEQALSSSPSDLFSAGVCIEQARLALCCRDFRLCLQILDRAACFLEDFRSSASSSALFLIRRLECRMTICRGWLEYEQGELHESLKSALCALRLARKLKRHIAEVHAWRLISRILLGLDGLRPAKRANQSAMKAAKHLSNPERCLYEAIVLYDRGALFFGANRISEALSLFGRALFLCDSIDKSEYGELSALRAEICIRLADLLERQKRYLKMHHALRSARRELSSLPLAYSLHIQSRIEAIHAQSILDNASDPRDPAEFFLRACNFQKAAMHASSCFWSEHLSRLIYCAQRLFHPSSHTGLFKEDLCSMALSQFELCKHKYPRFYLCAIAEMESRRGLICYLAHNYADAVYCFKRSIDRYDDYLRLYPNDPQALYSQLICRVNLIEAMDVEELRLRGEKHIRICFENCKTLLPMRGYDPGIVRLIDQLMSSEHIGVIHSVLLEDEYLELKGYKALSNEQLSEKFDA